MKIIKQWQYKNYFIHHYDEVASTNDLAISMINNRHIFANEIILADQQSKGRGRYDRQWISTPGNLFFSLILGGKKPAKNLGLPMLSSLSLVANIALNQTIQNLALDQKITIKIQNKWPNDLLIEDNKIAGILLENIIINNSCDFLILGIGVNINNNPQQQLFPASNLKHFKLEINAQNLLHNFLNIFSHLLQIWENFGFKNLRKLWLENAYNLGKKISIKDHRSSISGIFDDIDDSGNLLLKTDDKILTIYTGDILQPNIIKF